MAQPKPNLFETADFHDVVQIDVTPRSPGTYDVKIPVHALKPHYATYVKIEAQLNQRKGQADLIPENDNDRTIPAGHVTPVNGETVEVEAEVIITFTLPKLKTPGRVENDQELPSSFLNHREKMMNALNEALRMVLRPEYMEVAPGDRSSKADLIQMKLFFDLGMALANQQTPTVASINLTGVARIPQDQQGQQTGEPGGFGHNFDTLAANSGPAAPGKYMPHSISLQRTTRPLTGDVALWLLIKLNADTLSWDNYVRQLDLLFFPKGPDLSMPQTADPGAPLYNTTAQLSHRRFLPFTDTEAYRALKVATEAFLVTWGGVAPWAIDKAAIATLLTDDPAAVALANERLGLNLVSPDTTSLTKQYFGTANSPTLPYLQRVGQALQGTDAADVIAGALEDEEIKLEQQFQLEAKGHQQPAMWLRHWNDNISAKLTHPPLIELIWSYWMEEMQLVQTMNAVTRRFQNVSSGAHDPLGQLELDPLRPLNNMIWGWVQDEQHRLPIERRALEYRHHYGFQIFGKAVPSARPADNRSKFLEAFHTLLNLCVPFFRQADDTTVVPDGFPLLNALREVHLILSEGAHNQFRDLPTTARVEMMMQQWLLARPEFREFLPRRAMVAYPEPWMHSVESMRKLQGWGDTNVYQFWQLATTGEQIVSSIRWGDWNSINDPVNAANWATFFRPEIQTYIHSYRAVTGIDVSAEPVDVQVPGIHLLRRLQQRKGASVA
ncbi:hypothetical protein [Silvimonas amylolytica]|uniref:8-amino-7-oxononanoate synthase n=1 Tax=Silvimonas amylolytica TaxID=449663 RepID=A0ABQ2PNU2_9NEIS|nr:hypothetical protein [Silvimonas amylolytica]GGP26973.1 hypothetical protein GCM10010971_27920 [Silvimonas amylolytica]